MQESVYGRPYVKDNSELLQRFQERDGGVQYFGDHVDDLPPLGRLLGPINQDTRRTFKAMQDTDGYMQGVLQSVQSGLNMQPGDVRRMEKSPSSFHDNLLQNAKASGTIRDRRVPPIAESYGASRRKY